MNLSLNWRAAIVSLLLFAAFLVAWHIVTSPRSQRWVIILWRRMRVGHQIERTISKMDSRFRGDDRSGAKPTATNAHKA